MYTIKVVEMGTKLAHTNKIRFVTYLRPVVEEFVKERAIAWKCSVSCAIALILEKNQRCIAENKGAIAQIQGYLRKRADQLNWEIEGESKRESCYLSVEQSEFVKNYCLQNCGGNASIAINLIIREYWAALLVCPEILRKKND